MVCPHCRKATTLRSNSPPNPFGRRILRKKESPEQLRNIILALHPTFTRYRLTSDGKIGGPC